MLIGERGFSRGHAWKLPAKEIAARNYNLDCKNPHEVVVNHRYPEVLMQEYLEIARQLAAAQTALKQELMQVAKYADTTRVNLIENRDFGKCSLVKALKGILDRMAVENTIFTKIGYPLRKEQEMIDSTAMREAVVNAVVHNDYSYGGAPKFEFFSDRLEITSMGGLPYGVDSEDFFSGFSVPRNKEIMRVSRDLEIVEQLGSGIPRILKTYGREAFEIRKSLLRVVFHYTIPVSRVKNTSQQAVIPEKASGKTLVDGLVARLADGLAESQRLMLELIAENPRISKRAMAEKIGISTTAIDKNIAALKTKGLLTRIGSNKSGHWKVVADRHE
ncbi:MAG: winged helix-turn-helix transcriptional regulator [Syntrophobacterales bacterium]|nr:winged helix-turn-helix transcriptional regulator [Syntrophobacterales bacterium]